MTIRATVGELRLLTCLMRHPGVIRTHETLFEHLSAGQRDSDPRVVSTHVKRLRRKIRAVEPGCDPIATHYGLGYAMNAAIAS